MELACNTMSTGSKRTSAANQSASKRAKTVDSRMASQMGHYKLAGSPKRKNFTPRRRLALQYMDSSSLLKYQLQASVFQSFALPSSFSFFLLAVLLILHKCHRLLVA